MSDAFFTSDCVQSLEKLDSINNLLDHRTEILVTLTVARHAVDLVILAKLVLCNLLWSGTVFKNKNVSIYIIFHFLILSNFNMCCNILQ